MKAVRKVREAGFKEIGEKQAEADYKKYEAAAAQKNDNTKK